MFTLLQQENWLLIVGLIVTIIAIIKLKKYFSGVVYIIPNIDITGKNAIVTGGSSGIGEQTVRQLTKLGCTVIIADKDRRSAERIMKDIRLMNAKGRATFIYIDLASKDDILTFAESVQFDKIDYLINNAGVFALPNRKQTKEGYQMQLGINYLGHFYLTHLLWPKIIKSEFFRIVNVSSAAHKKWMAIGAQPKLDFDNFNFNRNYNGNLAYSRSKLYVTMFAKSLSQKIIQGKGLAVSVHPGAVRTGILNYIFEQAWYGSILKYYNYATYFSYYFFTKSPLQGSYTSLFAILDDKIENGCYYSQCAKDSINSEVTPQNSSKLWQLTQQLLQIKFDP